jgi:hypothetical protein
MTDQDDADAELMGAAAPFVQAAVFAALARDVPAIGEAWRLILPLGERTLMLALTALGDMATLGVPAPTARRAWMPVVRHHETGEPLDPDAIENAALAFVARFCVAGTARDRDTQRALAGALLAPAAEDEPSAEAEERVADAFTMLAQLAAQGIARERVRRERTHQHPQAPRRPNHRDQRKR